MKSNVLTMPCCYFPTQIVMVDDNEIFTQSLKLHIDSTMRIFNDAQIALKFLSQYTPTVTENFWLQAEYNTDLTDGTFIQPMLIDLGEIRSLQHEPERYQDISVVIMDYHMPTLNGLEVLRKISHKPFKTILLTGEGEHALAVDAFNEGQIDYFLRKDEKNLGEKLNQIIQKLQFEYFADMSKKSREIIAEDAPHILDQKICEYFYKIIQQNNITEFYLINLWGNYLLLNSQKEKQYFCAYTQAQLEVLAENASEDNAKPHVILDLNTGNKIPFFGENTPYWKIEGERWEEFMFRSEMIKTGVGEVFIGMIR